MDNRYNDPAYDSVGIGFKISYYVSALAPQYFLLLCLISIEHLEKFGIPRLIWTKDKKVFLIILVSFIISLCGLVFVRHYINIVKSDPEFYRSYPVHISYHVDPGLGAFFINILTPIILALPNLTYPITSLFMLFIIQCITFSFYYKSSDIFPNISLAFIYNIYETNQKNDSNHIEYILIKRNNKDRIYGRERYFGKTLCVSPFIPRNSNSQFAIYYRKTND